MKLNLLTSTITLISSLALVLVPTAAAKGKENTGYQTGFVRWRAASADENGVWDIPHFHC